jgi:hypothetical protein
VYEGRDRIVDRSVAIKVRHLPPDGARARRVQTRFLREARAAAQVHHPNVVTLFDSGVDGDLAFLVMELVQGETLAQILKRQGALSVRRTLALLVPLLSGVAELHAHGVIHRDVKPANILLTRDDDARAKLADFGVSRLMDEASSATETGAMLGTLDYMAPEVMLDVHEATEASDQYSLGVVLYECLTGARPFRALAAYELMRAVIHGTPARLSDLAPSLGDEIDRVVLRAMHRDPAQRFSSVDEFSRALLSLEGAPADGATSVAPSQVRRVVQRYPAIAVRDGLAIATRGDVFIALWRSPALIDRIQWQFDVADRFVADKPGGIVVLVLLLSSSAPPDAQTALECVKRIRRLSPRVRRQAVVALGGDMWRMIVKNIHRILASRIPARDWRITLSSTIHDGIGSLLEKGGPDTPGYDALAETVVALHDALDLNHPVIEATATARR